MHNFHHRWRKTQLCLKQYRILPISIINDTKYYLYKHKICAFSVLHTTKQIIVRPHIIIIIMFSWVQSPFQYSWLSKDTLMRSVLFRPDCRNQRWQFGPACQVAVSCLPVCCTPVPQLSAALRHCTSNEPPLAKPSFTTTYSMSFTGHLLTTASHYRIYD